jgi:hypothetical protein
MQFFEKTPRFIDNDGKRVHPEIFNKSLDGPCVSRVILIKTTDTKKTYVLFGKTADGYLYGTFTDWVHNETVMEAILDADRHHFMRDIQNMLIYTPDTCMRLMPKVVDSLSELKINAVDLKLLPQQTVEELNGCTGFHGRIEGYDVFAFAPRVIEMRCAEMDAILWNMSMLASKLAEQRTSIIKGLGLEPIEVKNTDGTAKTLQPHDDEYLQELRSICHKARLEGKSFDAHDKRMIALTLLDDWSWNEYTGFIVTPLESFRKMLSDWHEKGTDDNINCVDEEKVSIGQIGSITAADMWATLDPTFEKRVATAWTTTIWDVVGNGRLAALVGGIMIGAAGMLLKMW